MIPDILRTSTQQLLKINKLMMEEKDWFCKSWVEQAYFLEMDQLSKFNFSC